MLSDVFKYFDSNILWQYEVLLEMYIIVVFSVVFVYVKLFFE